MRVREADAPPAPRIWSPAAVATMGSAFALIVLACLVFETVAA